jgi:hypothetical protein
VNKALLRGLSAQEFAENPVSCFRASGESVFDMVAVDKALQGCSEPVEMKDTRRRRIYLPSQPGKHYIIGVAPAGGGCEGDYSCAELIDQESGVQCAELRGHFPPRELASRILGMAKQYNDALLAIERNNHGHGVLAHVWDAGYLNVYVEGETPILFHSPLFLNECRTLRSRQRHRRPSRKFSASQNMKAANPGGTPPSFLCRSATAVVRTYGYPTSSLQFSRVFFTSAMNWSATAPSIRR